MYLYVTFPPNILTKTNEEPIEELIPFKMLIVAHRQTEIHCPGRHDIKRQKRRKTVKVKAAAFN